MSLVTARKRRTTLYLCIAGLVVMAAAVPAISSRDPDGVSIRVGMIVLATGAALWLPRRGLIPAMKELEEQNVSIGSGRSDLAGMNPETGIFDASQLKPALTAELARSRRFNRPFSLMLVGIEELRQKFDYRDDAAWKASLNATTRLLRQTRTNVDRVFHHGDGGFAIILPESTQKDIPGLVRRLRRLARLTKPAEGEPGGPMPVHFGATFFPECATTVEDLLRRAEIALRIAVGNTTRYQLDGAEAPELPPVETLRRPLDNVVNVETDSEPLATQAAPEAAVAVAVMEAERIVAGEPHINSEARGPVALVATEELSVRVDATEAGVLSAASHEAPLAKEQDDLAALIDQMDGTLKLIRAVRNSAA